MSIFFYSLTLLYTLYIHIFTITSLLQFLITPVKIGLLDLRITATSGVGQDILKKALRVEAEGQTLKINRPIFLDMRSTSSLARNRTIVIPKHAVPDSPKVFLTAVADPLGVAMNNLNDLVEQPQGCGEQNLMRILPAAIIAAYLQETERFSGQIASTAIHLMETGYQRQLTYKLPDGSFTAFGPGYDERGSVSKNKLNCRSPKLTSMIGSYQVWITALTMSALRQAQPYIDVDESVINDAIQWLLKEQRSDGAFVESGSVVYGRIQDSAITMTAYVVICLLENTKTKDPTIQNSLNRAIDYLAKEFDQVEENDTYTLAILCYAFYRSLHPEKETALRKLNGQATREDGFMFWQLPLEDFEKGNPWTALPNSANIEMTRFPIAWLLHHF